MTEDEKAELINDLDLAIHQQSNHTPSGRWIEKTVIDPDSLKEVLQHIIEAKVSEES